MQRVAIVTDSYAHFSPPLSVTLEPITVVPNRLTLDGRSYRENVDLSTDEALRMIALRSSTPSVSPPSVSDYAAVYGRLSAEYDAILSIHASREISESWARAREAAHPYQGRCPIHVIDSQSISAGEAILARAALRALDIGDPAESVARMVRGAVDRLYAIFFTEQSDFLLHNGIMEPAQAILASMIGIKPILTIENGVLTPMEKVRTRSQAIERMVEFAVEFTEIEDAAIIGPRPGPSDAARSLQDRLSAEFPSRPFPYMMYGASLAALIGADATGLILLEEEDDELNNEY
ncbi:MAG: DegV family EDD domain-containing protein [Anaerolineae bacterium]|nr:DegV family EDD domain-containing protein [Anaerolineae bacterium]